jgi:dihydrofolate reductase
MRKVLFFMLTSLDGYFEGPDHDISWHNVDEEFNEFAINQLNSVDTLLFGRVTYELMAAYWPTPQAIENDPVVADKMNTLPKLVFSRTLKKVSWQNTKIIAANFGEEIRALKSQPGKDMIIFGSSDLAVSFIELGLIDEFRILVNPVVLGRGKILFQGIQNQYYLKLARTQQFKSGNVLLVYIPGKKAI